MMKDMIFNRNGIEAYIFRNSNNYFYLYFKKRGARKRISLNTQEYTEALKQAFSQIDNLKNGLVRIPTFEEIVDEYLKLMPESSKKKYYVQRLNAVFIPYFYKKKISEITEKLISDLTFKRMAEVKPQSVNKEMVILKALLKYSKKRGYIDSIPTIEKLKEENNKREAFSIPEISELFNVSSQRIETAKHPRTKFDLSVFDSFIHFLAETGIRVGEALSIKFSGINNDIAKLTSSKTLVREIFLNTKAQNIIQNLKNLYENYGLETCADSYIFLNYKGEKIKSFRKVFNTTLSHTSMKQMLGRNTLTQYSFRHFYITQALQEKIPLAAICIQCGTSIKMIQKNYNHLTIHTVKNELQK